MQTAQILFAISLLCYFLSTCGYWWNIKNHRRVVFTLASVGVGVGVAAQTVGMVLYALRLGRLPLSTFSEVVMVVSWVIVLVYAAGELRYRTGSLGSFLVPLAFIGMSLSMAFPSAQAKLDAEVQSIWFSVHIVFAFAGIAAFALIFGVGIMYMIQESTLKSKKIGAFYYRLPSLSSLDGINATAQSVGFPMLTLGLIAGAIWASSAKGSPLQWDPQRTLPLLVTWGFYAVLFAGRLFVGWRGHKPSMLAVVGFCLAVLTYLIHAAR